MDVSKVKINRVKGLFKDEAIKNEKLSRTNCVSIFDSHWRYGC